MLSKISYHIPRPNMALAPNIWDSAALAILLGIVVLLSLGASHMNAPYQLGQVFPISLKITALPTYALYTIIRMFIALFLSMVFTLIVGKIAASNKHAERIIIPLIDILQSIPVLGVLSITVVAFIQLFPNNRLGPEGAAIFAIFTSQVWNMTFSFYQSLKSIPHDLHEASSMFHLSAWQKFWRLEVPIAIPGLLWNTMVSMSASWFFVVASEAIIVSNQTIALPGIGSYINEAIIHADTRAIVYATLTMFTVILCYDQLLFRPLIKWGERFKMDSIGEEEVEQESWFYEVLTRTRFLKYLGRVSTRLFSIVLTPRHPQARQTAPLKHSQTLTRLCVGLFYGSLLIATLSSAYVLFKFIHVSVNLAEIKTVLYLGAITSFKVLLLVILSSIVWIPIGVWIGQRPRFTQLSQPIVQFLASFPVNLIYPLIVYLVVEYKLNPNIWTTPLMVLGTQWYILFNVIAGVSAIPQEIKFAAKNFGLKGKVWWTRLILPAIFPYYVTGAMTAAGGCWNASIVADYIEWGDITIEALGLGWYITKYTMTGDFPRVALGIAVMCLYVMAFNHLIWQKLYAYAEERFTLG